MNHFKWVTLMNKVEKSFFGIDDNWTKKLKGKKWTRHDKQDILLDGTTALGIHGISQTNFNAVINAIYVSYGKRTENSKKLEDLKPFEIQCYSTTRKQNFRNDCLKFVN